MNHAHARTRCSAGTTGLLLALTLLAAGATTAVRAMEPTGAAAGEAGRSGGVQPPVPQPAEAPVGSIIIKYKETVVGQSLSPAAMEQVMVSALRRLGDAVGVALTHDYVIGGGAQVAMLPELVSREQAEEIARELARDEMVEYAEPNLTLTIQGAPDDPRYDEQWHYYESPASIDVADSWDLSSGAGVVVAIVDTGIVAHADLAGQVLPGYDMIADLSTARDGNRRDGDPSDPGDWAEPGDFCYDSRDPRYNYSSWHGTHVAGTVAAVTGNATGVAGVAWSASILPVRVLGRCGGRDADVADGIRWAAGLDVPGVPQNANPAQVINLSLGGFGWTCPFTLQDAISDATAIGATVVVAGGNSSTDAGNFVLANCKDVVVVAALDRDGYRAWYSNYGTVVDVAAPGGDTEVFFDEHGGVLSTSNTGREGPEEDAYAFYQGTSMATPHVSAVAAMLYDLDPRITPAQVTVALTRGSRDFAVDCFYCDRIGAGMLDVPNALLTGRLARRLPIGVLMQSLR